MCILTKRRTPARFLWRGLLIEIRLSMSVRQIAKNEQPSGPADELLERNLGKHDEDAFNIIERQTVRTTVYRVVNRVRRRHAGAAGKFSCRDSVAAEEGKKSVPPPFGIKPYALDVRRILSRRRSGSFVRSSLFRLFHDFH